MTPTELKAFIRDMTLVGVHELSEATLDTLLQEAFGRLTHRQVWDWLLRPVESIIPAGPVFDLTTLTYPPAMSIADISPVDNDQMTLHQVTRTQHTFLTRPRHVGGRPRVYWVEGSSLYMDPEPGEEDEFNILYSSVDAWDVSADAPVPQVPEQFQTSTVGNYVIHRIWERQEDFERSDAYLGRYELAVSDLREYENRFNDDGPKIYGQLATSLGPRQHMPWLDGLG